MTNSQATIFCKTGAGLEEMHSRQAGLDPRVRQLLILIDGKRNLHELQKLMASAELEEFVAVLELKGLIAPDTTQLPIAGVAASTAIGYAGPAYAGGIAGKLTGLAGDALEAHEGGVAVAHAPREFAAPIGRGLADSGQVAVDDRLVSDRQRLAALLADAVGPMSDELCGRILQARRPDELAELFRATLAVVELMSGRKAAERFVEKLKSLGWEY